MLKQEQTNSQDSNTFLDELWASQPPEIQYILEHDEQSVQAELLRQLIPLLHFHSLTVEQLAHAFVSNLELGTVLKDEYERRYSFEDITDVALEDLQDFQTRLARQKELDPKLKSESQTARVHAQVIESLIVRIIEWYASVGNFEMPEELRQEQVEGHLERLEQIEVQVSQAQPEAGFIVAGVVNEIKRRTALYTSWAEALDDTAYSPDERIVETKNLQNILTKLLAQKPEWFEQCKAELGEEAPGNYEVLSCLEILTPGQLHEVYHHPQKSLDSLARILFQIYRHHIDAFYEERKAHVKKRAHHEDFLVIAEEILKGEHDTEASIYDILYVHIELEEEEARKKADTPPPDTRRLGNEEKDRVTFVNRMSRLDIPNIPPQVPEKASTRSNPKYYDQLVGFLKWAEEEVDRRAGTIPESGWTDSQMNGLTGTSESDRMKLQKLISPSGKQIGASYRWTLRDVKLLFVAKALDTKGWRGTNNPHRFCNDLSKVFDYLEERRK